MPNLVMILGPGRTGTSMTHLMLGNAKNAFACGEIYAFFRPWRTHHFKPMCSCAHNYSDCVWRKFDNTNEESFHKALAQQLDVKWVVDESKNLNWVLDTEYWARSSNMQKFNIIMVKEPIGFMYSQWKRERPLETATKYFLKYYQRFLALNVPFVSVKLEELTADPATKLEKICNVIGMKYFEGKERFWEKQHCHLFGSLGLRSQITNGDMEIRHQTSYPKQFLQVADPQLKAFENSNCYKRVHSKLMAKEIDNIDRYDGIVPLPTKGLRPAWYYRNVLKSAFRKRFPMRWKHAQ